MKAIRIILDVSEEAELNLIRNKENDSRSERALMILLNASGLTAPTIANRLRRNAHTVRACLKAFISKGMAGLERDYSPGRPSKRREQLIPFIKRALGKLPSDFGWPQQCWTKQLLMQAYSEDSGKEVSSKTMERALKDAGYSYKRPKKRPPAKAPSKEEKLSLLSKTIKEIEDFAKNADTELVLIDESHFSTEPYNLRGWFKKGEYFFPEYSGQKGRMHYFWSLESGKERFLLEKRGKRKR